jgi:SSS family solute:Na+ symporter/sodium/proline symporter
MGAVFAKIMSTANNFLFSPATNLINDVFVRYISPDASNKRVLLVSRLVVVLLGVWALVQAMHAESVLQKAIYAYTIYSAALTPVILAAFYSKRANAAGAATAIAAGTFITVFWDTAFVRNHVPVWAADSDFAIFPALAASVLGLVVVSALTRPPSAEQVALFHAGAATEAGD